MRRVIVLGAAGVALAGCSSLSLPSLSLPDFLTPAPPVVTLQLDSRPPGATAATSTGTGCRTPCSVQLVATPGVTVTYTLDRHLPQTISLQVVQHQGPPAPDGSALIVTDFEPNPVLAELQPTIPPRKGRRGAPPPKKPKSAQAPPAPAPSPFPPPPPAR